MKTSVLILLLACLPKFDAAQANNFSVSQKLSSHAALSRYEPDIGSIMGNQAAAMQVKGFSYGMMAEKKYLLGELNEVFMFISRTSSSQNMMMMLGYAGYANTSMLQPSFGYSRKLSDQTALGLRLNLTLQHISGYKNMIVPGVEISMCHNFSEKLQTGMLLVNPHEIFIKEKVPAGFVSSCLKWGWVYDATKQCYLFCDLVKKDSSPMDVIMGIVLHFKHNLHSACSISFLDMSSRLTIGFDYGKMNIRFSGTFHGQLGLYPGVFISSQNKKP